MKMEFKTFLKSYVFSAAVLFTGASASADEYVLTVVPVENDKDKFQIQCVNFDKRQADALSVVRDLCKKRVFLETSPSGEVAVNLNTPEDYTGFSFNIGSFKFCYTFSFNGGVMKITGGKETDSLQIQNLIDNQTFEINAIKANMLSIERGSWKTEVISMSNCNANTVLLTDFGTYKRLLFKTSEGDYIHKVLDVRKGQTSEEKLIGVYEEPLLKTSGENYIHNLILSGAHIWNDGMMKVDGIFCNVDGSVEGCFPSVFSRPSKNCSQNALILRDEDLVKNDSTLEEVDSTSKNCTFFSNTSDPRVEKHEDSSYELPERGCYRFILLGNFKCSGEKDVYCLLRKEDFNCLAGCVADPRKVFGTYLRLVEAPVDNGGQYNRNAFVSLFKNVKSVNLRIGKALNHDLYQPCELKCASMGHALVIIREDDLHQETHQETHQGENSPFFNEIKKRIIFFQ